MSNLTPVHSGKRAVVAVIHAQNQFLAIRRSQMVKAPGKICFPGGTINPGETEEAALVREVEEELGISSRLGPRLYHNFTSWGTSVAWWSVEIAPDAVPVLQFEEVADWQWMCPRVMLRHPDLLSSNRDFLTAWRRQAFLIPGIGVPAGWGDSDD